MGLGWREEEDRKRGNRERGAFIYTITCLTVIIRLGRKGLWEPGELLDGRGGEGGSIMDLVERGGAGEANNGGT